MTEGAGTSTTALLHHCIGPVPGMYWEPLAPELKSELNRLRLQIARRPGVNRELRDRLLEFAGQCVSSAASCGAYLIARLACSLRDLMRAADSWTDAMAELVRVHLEAIHGLGLVPAVKAPLRLRPLGEEFDRAVAPVERRVNFLVARARSLVSGEGALARRLPASTPAGGAVDAVPASLSRAHP